MKNASMPLTTVFAVLDIPQGCWVTTHLYSPARPAALRQFLFPILIGLLKSKALQAYPQISVEYFDYHFKSIEENFPNDEVEIEKLVCCSWVCLELDYKLRDKKKRSAIADFWKCLSLGTEEGPRKGQIFSVFEKPGRLHYLPFFHNELGYGLADYENEGPMYYLEVPPKSIEEYKQGNLHWSMDQGLLEEGKLLLAKVPTSLDTLYQLYFYEIWIFFQTHGKIFPLNIQLAYYDNCLEGTVLQAFLSNFSIEGQATTRREDASTILDYTSLIWLLLYPIPTEYLTDNSKYFLIKEKGSLPPYPEV